MRPLPPGLERGRPRVGRVFTEPARTAPTLFPSSSLSLSPTRGDRAEGVRERPATAPESGAVSAATASLSSGEGAPSESVAESSDWTSRLARFFEAAPARAPALRRSPPLFAGEGENTSAAGPRRFGSSLSLPAIKSRRLGPTPPIERSEPARPAPAADAAPPSARFAPAKDGGGAARSANKSLAVTSISSSSTRPANRSPPRPNPCLCAEGNAALAPVPVDAGVAAGARLEISSMRSCVSRATWRSSQSGDPPAGAAPEGVVANIAAGLRGEARGTWRVRGKRARGEGIGVVSVPRSRRFAALSRRTRLGGKTAPDTLFARTSSDRVRRELVRSRRTAWRPPLDRGVAGLTRTRGAWDGSRVPTARARVAPRVAFSSSQARKKARLQSLRRLRCPRRLVIDRARSRNSRHSSPRGG